MATNAPAEETPKVNHKRSYSEFEKELIVNADIEGGPKKRHEVAKSLNMPANTANHIIQVFHSKGFAEAIKDHRHDRQVHLNGAAKKDSALLKLLVEWLHLDKNLTWSQLRDLINLEIFRRLVTQAGLATAEEAVPNTPITSERIKALFSVQALREEFEKQHVKAEGTIAAWIDGLIISRKHHLDDSKTGNDDAHKVARKAYAGDLVTALEREDCEVVFIDACPFHLRMHHPPGQGVDDKIDEFTEVLTATSPNLGLLTFHSYVTKDLPPLKEGVHNSAEAFKRFLNKVVAVVEERKEFEGKNVYFITDWPKEYVESVEKHKSTHQVPEFEKLNKKLKASGKAAHIIKMAPLSPPLNLGEFYIRKIREGANEMLVDLTMNENDDKHKEFLKKNEKGHHDHLLRKILDATLVKIQSESLDTKSLVRMVDAAKQVTADNGYLNFGETYQFLYR